jgi:hypothetical protein
MSALPICQKSRLEDRESSRTQDKAEVMTPDCAVDGAIIFLLCLIWAAK